MTLTVLKYDEHGADAGRIKCQGVMQVLKNNVDEQIKKESRRKLFHPHHKPLFPGQVLSLFTQAVVMTENAIITNAYDKVLMGVVHGWLLLSRRTGYWILILMSTNSIHPFVCFRLGIKLEFCCPCSESKTVGTSPVSSLLLGHLSCSLKTLLRASLVLRLQRCCSKPCVRA